MDIGAVGGSGQTAYTQQISGEKELPKIVDVMSGALSDRQGLMVTLTGGTRGVTAADLTKSQEADLEALLAVLGIDSENAKTATIQTVLQAIQKSIRQQVSVFETTTKVAAVSPLTDLDATTLAALKKAINSSGTSSWAASKIVDNINRMFELKESIEDKANNQGMTYDGKFESYGREAPSNPNFSLNTDVREMGDRIGDIRYYCRMISSEEMDSMLDSLAPAMKTAVKDLLSQYSKTSGWGMNVIGSYSMTTSVTTIQRYINIIKSDDLQLPSQISKDALVKILEELIEELGPNATAQQAADKIEEKMQEIQAQLNDIEIETPIQA